MSRTDGVWEGIFPVYSSDTDFRGKGRLSYILDVMQHAADSAVQAYNVSLADMLKLNMGWMLMTLELDIQRMPKVEENLHVRTWSKGTKGALWQRDFRIYAGSVSGEAAGEPDEASEIASARTIWALVDIEKRRMLRPSAFPGEAVHYTGDSAGEMPAAVKPAPETVWNEAYRHTVRYSGLDPYGHLNNARYGDLCCDTVTQAEWSRQELSRFQITYVQEATFGDELTVLRAQLPGSATAVRGVIGDRVCFEAELVWIESVTASETSRRDGEDAE